MRNVIYQLLFVQDEPIRISQEYSAQKIKGLVPADKSIYRSLIAPRNLRFRTPIGYMPKAKLSSSNVTGTSLLKLNYETYLEASSVLYSENCFRFSTMDSLVQFLEPLTPRTRTCFRSIQLWTAYKSGKGVIRDITPAFCPPDPWLNLDRFELYHGIPNFSDPTLTFDGLARSLLNQSHLLAWLKTVGNAKGDPMAGTEILRLSDKMLRGCCPDERHSEDLAEIFKKVLADLLASPEYA